MVTLILDEGDHFFMLIFDIIDMYVQLGIKSYVSDVNERSKYREK